MPAPRASRVRRPLLVAAASAAVAGCSVLAPGRFVADRAPPPPEVARATVEASRRPPPAPAPQPAPPPPAEPRSLADLVDLALRQDPLTRATWLDARAAAATAGSRRGLYQPSLSATAPFQRQRLAAVPSRPSFSQTTYGASATLSWTLLDLGGRGALVDEADRLVDAARLGEQAAVADLVLRVEQTYDQYLAARALVDAEGAAVKTAEASLAAAEDRRRAGVATIADVLQARTALSQARLALHQLEGQALELRGALAVLAGLPPTVELDVGVLPADVKIAESLPAVEALLDEAAARSPDLARARAIADAAAAHARAASVAWGPLLSFDAGAGRTWYVAPEAFGPQTSWNVGLTLRLPLFDGLSPVYDAMAARAAAAAAAARADVAAQQVALSVWTSFQTLRSAGRQVETARDLLASARESADVAQGRYREGVGSILDLLTAQAALESARAEEVRARADYLVGLAQLTRATGRLELPAARPSAATDR
ncbi:TolC family protein [Anaeromyxobacter oryzae]|uniref:Protein CyaE n=1 Tax=Anaeromyxobacter oryzae TaxID=2918170 RepID=A0ABM7X4Z9_9BACT|nr:TolC family protein [Anaeromyxobacter oryzae]BDG06885.1 protein CyaE [Anaeromyxobacter oryzae]